MTNFKRALLVEDEENLAISLGIALKKLSISATRVENLEQARARLEDEDFDLILLDRTLPDGDGLSLCKDLRENEYKGAILMLTARGQPFERVEGLKGGADEYLAKPFSWEELEARIAALFRTRRLAIEEFQHDQSKTDEIEGWTLEEGRLRIQHPLRGWVDLTPLEFRLAKRLMAAKGEIVSRDILLKDVWGFTLLPRTRTVDHFMGRLRKLFETNPDDPKHFLTARGAGYRFEK